MLIKLDAGLLHFYISLRFYAEMNCRDVMGDVYVRVYVIVYKALHIEAPPYMTELFLKLSDTQCRELRNSSTDIYIPRLKTSMGQKSFGYRGVRFWNNLIDEAKEAKTYFAFKRILSKRIKQ